MREIKEKPKLTMSDAKEKLIVALDCSSENEALNIINKLHDKVGMFKVGLQLFTSCGPSIIKEIKKLGSKVFLDLKLFDIPTTIELTSKAITRMGVDMFNVHALGGSGMMIKANFASLTESRRLGIQKPRVLAVTILTSMDREDLICDLNMQGSVQDNVERLTIISFSSGLDGIVCSVEEAKHAKTISKRTTIVTPGIRPVWATKNDQKRSSTPYDAIKEKSDYLVVGRPITSPPKNMSMVEATETILDEILGAMWDFN